MQRFEDWPARLAAFFAARAPMPFWWGHNDCCLFAADAVLAMTGVDVAGELRGYVNHVEAARHLRKFGGVESVAEHFAAAHALLEISRAAAGRGDIALLDGERGPTLLIVALDARFACGPGPFLMRHVLLASCRRFWRI